VQAQTQATARQADTAQAFERVQPKLDKLELTHLRAYAAELATQLECATDRAQRAEARIDDTYRWACDILQEELQKLTNPSGPTLGLTQAGELQVQPADAAKVPAPGQHWPAMGGTYIGIASAEGGIPAHHLVVLDAKPDTALNWSDAKAWAAQQGNGARLPTQLEAMLAWTNARAAFEKHYHWTSTQVSRSYAFVQDFEYGSSYWDNKGLERRVRAFRGFQLETLNPLTLAAEGGSAEISAGGAA